MSSNYGGLPTTNESAAGNYCRTSGLYQAVIGGSAIRMTNSTPGGTWQILNDVGTATVDVHGNVTGLTPGRVVIFYLTGGDTIDLSLWEQLRARGGINTLQYLDSISIDFIASIQNSIGNNINIVQTPSPFDTVGNIYLGEPIAYPAATPTGGVWDSLANAELMPDGTHVSGQAVFDNNGNFIGKFEQVGVSGITITIEYSLNCLYALWTANILPNRGGSVDVPTYILPHPKGIDYWIQALQIRMYAKLCAKWGVGSASYNCFGRAYRNNTADGYIPEFYDPTTGNYVAGDGANNEGGLFYQDTLAAMSFFGLVDPIKVDDGITTAKVQLMFFVDLSKIKAGGLSDSNGQRMDDACVNDVQNFIQSQGNNLTVHAVYKDIDKVLERYSGTLKKRALKDDMHPKFCFRLDLELRYNTLLNT